MVSPIQQRILTGLAGICSQLRVPCSSRTLRLSPLFSCAFSCVVASKMGRVVITGCSGVVGTVVVAYAIQFTKHYLVLIDVKPPSPTEEQIFKLKADRVERHLLDLRDFARWAEVMRGADALIHLAAFAQPAHVPPHITHNTRK